MKVLYVISGNSHSFLVSPFIQEQTSSIAQKGIDIDFFFIYGRGIWGYLKNLPAYYKKIKEFKPDIIHAHYGLSGVFANLQFDTPVITTFHGSDINLKKNRPFSFIASRLSSHSIFVSEKLSRMVKAKKTSIIPCGFNPELFYPIDKIEARDELGLNRSEKLVLFSNSFTYFEKNYPLARKAIDILKGDVTLIELKGYRREEVNLLMNACDLALMTSFSEGSPQFIKEAMACNCPIVSTDVGDVKLITKNLEGCFVTSYDANEIAQAIKQALYFGKRTNGRKNIEHLMNSLLSDKIIDIYKKTQN